MIVAIIGSRSLSVDSFEKYVGGDDVIISGGADGIDQCAVSYAIKNGIAYEEILPDYKKYGKAAPIIRNKEIVRRADKIIAFWDGKSRGTLFTVNYAKGLGVPCEIILMNKNP